MSRPKTLRHMSRQDERVLAAYVFTPEGQSYTAWEFDVLVGDPEMPGAHFPLNSRRQAAYLNALKVDAVAWQGAVPTAIEAKPRGGLAALGQIRAYRQWFAVHYGTTPQGIILCSSMSRQVQTSALWDGIKVVILPPASDYQVQLAEAYVKSLIVQRSVLPQFSAVQNF